MSQISPVFVISSCDCWFREISRIISPCSSLTDSSGFAYKEVQLYFPPSLFQFTVDIRWLPDYPVLCSPVACTDQRNKLPTFLLELLRGNNHQQSGVYVVKYDLCLIRHKIRKVQKTIFKSSTCPAYVPQPFKNCYSCTHMGLPKICHPYILEGSITS